MLYSAQVDVPVQTGNHMERTDPDIPTKIEEFFGEFNTTYASFSLARRQIHCIVDLASDTEVVVFTMRLTQMFGAAPTIDPVVLLPDFPRVYRAVHESLQKSIPGRTSQPSLDLDQPVIPSMT